MHRRAYGLKLLQVLHESNVRHTFAAAAAPRASVRARVSVCERERSAMLDESSSHHAKHSVNYSSLLCYVLAASEK